MIRVTLFVFAFVSIITVTPAVAFSFPPPSRNGITPTAAFQLSRPITLLMMNDKKWTEPDELETSRRALLTSTLSPFGVFFLASSKLDEMGDKDRSFQVQDRLAGHIFQLQVKDKLNTRQSKLLATLMKEQIDHKYLGIKGEARLQAFKSEKELLGMYVSYSIVGLPYAMHNTLLVVERMLEHHILLSLTPCILLLYSVDKKYDKDLIVLLDKDISALETNNGPKIEAQLKGIKHSL